LKEASHLLERCLELAPDFHAARHSYALVLMRMQVTAEGGDADDQSHLAFALGKALEDGGVYDESFKFYRRGNTIRRIKHKHNPKINVLEAVRQVRALDRAFFEQRKGWGCQAPDPIFIVGLPRAGSTLLEQILASHSQVEGTTALQDIIAISRKLGGKSRQHPSGKYPECLAEMKPGQFRELDFEEQYLRFYESDRAVRTPSSEQVRKPIYKEGLEQWRNFEAHVDPLKEALGPEVRQRYSINL